jgi:hypothetical protein
MATLILAAFLFLLQSPSRTVVIHDGPFDSAYGLRLTLTTLPPTPWPHCCPTVLHVLLVDRRDPDRSWELARLEADREVRYRLERAGDGVILISKADPDYGGDEGQVKLFVDVRAKRLLKRVDYTTPTALTFANNEAARRMLGVSAGGLTQLRRTHVFESTPPTPPDIPLPFSRYALPQSTYQEFARRRPARVQNGYDEAHTSIREHVGAMQRVGDRLWFGKAFYDGEFLTGVGAVGSLDVRGTFTFVSIPELVDWSVSALLVEAEAIWLARVLYGEGAAHPGGLLRYDRATGRVSIHDIGDEIHSLVRVDGALFVGSSHGAYILRDGQVTRIRMEPTRGGTLAPVSTRR